MCRLVIRRFFFLQNLFFFLKNDFFFLYNSVFFDVHALRLVFKISFRASSIIGGGLALN